MRFTILFLQKILVRVALLFEMVSIPTRDEKKL